MKRNIRILLAILVLVLVFVVYVIQCADLLTASKCTAVIGSMSSIMTYLLTNLKI